LRNDATHQELRDGEFGEVPTVVPSPPNDGSNAPLPPDLARLVDAWPSLPPAIKAGILAMIAASGGSDA
jgi:hypothetical protein